MMRVMMKMMIAIATNYRFEIYYDNKELNILISFLFLKEESEGFIIIKLQFSPH